jgi:SAM-dependent methyltransferase
MSMSLPPPLNRHRAEQAAPGQAPDEAVPARPGRESLGLARSVRLFRLFLQEQTDPVRFYACLAQDAVCQVADHCEISGRTVVDIGGGAGYFTTAFRARGAECYLFEPDPAEMCGGGIPQPGAVIADGYWLPVGDGCADVCFSSNVLEHVRDPGGLIDEMVRVTRPGGLIYLSFTNWYSPWGGHELSPWHYLGHRFAERRYLRAHQRLPKHKLGVNLFPLHVGPTLRQLRSRADVEVVDALPRYYPQWCRPIVRVPWVREIATWNLLLILRRKA